MNKTTDYWFTIEPYVYVNIVNKSVLLYNTIDGASIKSDEADVVALLQDMLQEENCGVVLLKNDQYKQVHVKEFINKLREKYMGDIIDINLSNGKPVQIIPYFNYPAKYNKKCDFLLIDNLLQTLFEINIHIDHTTNIERLVGILQLTPENVSFNIKGNLENTTNTDLLFSFLNQRITHKYIECDYNFITVLDPKLKNNFSYKIFVNFPIDESSWSKCLEMLSNQNFPFEYIFNVTSFNDCKEAELLIEDSQNRKYRIVPIYNENNIDFFKENVYLTQDDILSMPITLKDIFSRLSMNMHDFGKFNVMPNGDVYANVKHHLLGNIYTHSIYELIQKEIKEGESWLRTRTQVPCCDCIYQYLCPSPSDYEIVIGSPNLCHIRS